LYHDVRERLLYLVLFLGIG